MKKLTVDQGAFETVCAHVLTFAAHVEGKPANFTFPKLESIGLGLELILSGFKNTGKYKSSDIAAELRDMAKHFDQVEGPKNV